MRHTILSQTGIEICVCRKGSVRMCIQYGFVKLDSNARCVRNFEETIDKFGSISSDDVEKQRTLGKLIFKNEECWRDSTKVHAGDIAYRSGRVVRRESDAVLGTKPGDFQHLGITAGIFDIWHHYVKEPTFDIWCKTVFGDLTFGAG